MKTVTYKCDRCKKAIDHPKEQAINIIIAWDVEPQSPSMLNVSSTAQWCRQCAEDYRLAPNCHPKRELPEPAPTIADLIREIVREEIQE